MSRSKRKSKTVVYKQRSNLPQGVSREETELANTIQLEFPNKKIERSNRQILNGRELDIYIPENKVAFEYDGVYFHSTAKKDDSFYHLWKTIECEKRGIRLIHVLSDEWELKRSLVVDLVRKSLGKCCCIDAKECNLVKLTPIEEQVFLTNNHLLGSPDKSALCLGLSFENQIMMVVSVAHKDPVWMITRIAYRKNYFVRNGLKLIVQYLQRVFATPLYASIDRRFESAQNLLSIGFKEITPTNPVASYTKDFKQRFREKDFKNFDEAALIKNGWQKVYDCGRRRFILDSKGTPEY